MASDEMLQGFGVALKVKIVVNLKICINTHTAVIMEIFKQHDQMGATKADLDACVAIHPVIATNNNEPKPNPVKSIWSDPRNVNVLDVRRRAGNAPTLGIS